MPGLCRHFRCILCSLGILSVVFWGARGYASESFYLWQRIWNDSLVDALKQENDIGELFFIAGDLELGRSIYVVPNDEILKKFRGRATPVVRIHERRLARTSDQELARIVINLFEPIRSKHRLTSLQIDLDVPESKLERYTTLMRSLRAKYPKITLSATVLPVHLNHVQKFSALANACDFFVLQLHWLDRTRNPPVLMDAAVSTKAFDKAKSVLRPFKIALPTYGYMLHYAKNSDKLLFVSTELVPHRNSKEKRIIVEPNLNMISDFVQKARESKVGILWFRYPAPGDLMCLERSVIKQLSDGKKVECTLKTEWKKYPSGAVVLSLTNSAYLGKRDVKLTLTWPDKTNLTDSDTLNFFVKQGHPVPTVLQGVIPKPGETQEILWVRTEAETLLPPSISYILETK